MGYKQIVWQMKDKRKTNAAIEVDIESKVIEKGVEWETKESFSHACHNMPGGRHDER